MPQPAQKICPRCSPLAPAQGTADSAAGKMSGLGLGLAIGLGLGLWLGLGSPQAARVRGGDEEVATGLVRKVDTGSLVYVYIELGAELTGRSR